MKLLAYVAADVQQHVMDCIECGLCTYICPSKIAVTENVRRAKNFIRLQGGKK